MLLHRPTPSASPISLPVLVSLLYVGAISLWFLYLRALIPGLRHPPGYPAVELALDLAGHLGDSLRRASLVLTVMLISFLWLHWRRCIQSTGATAVYLATCVLVALTHVALVHLLASLPRYTLTPVP